MLSTSLAHASDTERSWSGFYVGFQGGWSGERVDTLLFIPSGSNIHPAYASRAIDVGNNDFRNQSALFGIQGGYNWEHGPLVLGVEGDLSYTSLSNTSVRGRPGIPAMRSIDEVGANFLATIRGRAGVKYADLLLFATAGVAYTDARLNRTLEWSGSPCPLGSTGLARCHVGSGAFKVGYTVGTGVEWGLSDKTSLKADYLFATFGKAEFRTRNPITLDQTLDHGAALDIHVLRLGLNFRF